MVGKTVAHYRILETLGSGGMGLVYKAEDTRLGRKVALKFLPDRLTRDPQALQRFQREARAASALNHPNICTVHDLGEHEGQPFIVMEFLDGETLKQRLRRQRPGLDEILELAMQVATGLSVAHAQGIIHRDIKPANIFLTTSRYAKILDFGVAKLVSETPQDSAAPTALSEELLTSPGTALGTIAYMSPEQALGKELDTRTDLFSLGAVLYETSTGSLPFQGETAAGMFNAILNQEPVSPLNLNSNLPQDLDYILAKALAKDREERYQSAQEMTADLRRLRRQLEPGASAGATGRLAARGFKARRLAIALLVLMAAAIAALGIYAVRPLPPPRVTRTVQVTNSAGLKWRGRPVTDGTRVFFCELRGSMLANVQIFQTSAAGGEPTLVPGIRAHSAVLWDISPDGGELLYGDRADSQPGGFPVWTVPSVGGAPRRLSDVIAVDAAFSPDGRRIAYTRRRDGLYVAQRDGAHPVKIASSNVWSYSPS